jgi:hypothetical protein
MYLIHSGAAKHTPSPATRDEHCCSGRSKHWQSSSWFLYLSIVVAKAKAPPTTTSTTCTVAHHHRAVGRCQCPYSPLYLHLPPLKRAPRHWLGPRWPAPPSFLVCQCLRGSPSSERACVRACLTCLSLPLPSPRKTTSINLPSRSNQRLFVRVSVQRPAYRVRPVFRVFRSNISLTAGPDLFTDDFDSTSLLSPSAE